jgi:hypothetical protein
MLTCLIIEDDANFAVDEAGVGIGLAFGGLADDLILVVDEVDDLVGGVGGVVQISNYTIIGQVWLTRG